MDRVNSPLHLSVSYDATACERSAVVGLLATSSAVCSRTSDMDTLWHAIRFKLTFLPLLASLNPKCEDFASAGWYCNPRIEREREIALVHSASLAYEDGSVFMSIAMGPDTAVEAASSIPP